MEQMTQRIREAIDRDACLKPHLRSMGEYYATKASLPKTRTVGKQHDISHETLQALRLFFGARNVKTGERIQINLQDFLNAAQASASDFGDSLLACFNLTAQTHASTSDSGKELRDRLCLEFPNLAESITIAFRSGATASQWAKHPDEAHKLCQVAHDLLNNTSPIRLSNLGAKIFNNSKKLRKNTNAYLFLADLLRYSLDAQDLSRHQALEQCLVIDNSTSVKVTVFGPFQYFIGEERFDWIKRLWHQGQAAMLTLQNIERITSISLPQGHHRVITCENETPFCDLIATLPTKPVIYTGGYPNAAVKSFLKGLPTQVREFQHWGDSDTDGLIIAHLLNEIRPVTLHRCGLDDLARHRNQLIPLSAHKRQRAQRLLSENPAFPFRDELSYTLQHGWLEQEAWCPEANES